MIAHGFRCVICLTLLLAEARSAQAEASSWPDKSGKSDQRRWQNGSDPGDEDAVDA
ncbi:MAG TPA: hypothetical protein VME44_03145 [Streptosporangiaceae bacterium]|nr:hypothetical protein [Streptosporangiaceae bacterium]